LKTKELDQFMCDWYPNGYEVAINAQWLQEQIRELNRLKRENQVLVNKNETLQMLSILNTADSIEYRINVRG
jgi:hypothetical protein